MEEHIQQMLEHMGLVPESDPHQRAIADVKHLAVYVARCGATGAMQEIGLDYADGAVVQQFRDTVTSEAWQKCLEHIQERLRERIMHEIACSTYFFKMVHSGMAVTGDLEEVMRAVAESREDED